MEGVDYLVQRMRLLAFLLVGVGLLAAVSCSVIWPPKPPPQSWANGVYYNECCAPLTLRDGVISTEGRSATYKVEDGKQGFFINVATGISVKAGHVVFGGTFAYVQFDEDNSLDPAVHQANAMHLYSWDDDNDFVFARR